MKKLRQVLIILIETKKIKRKTATSGTFGKVILFIIFIVFFSAMNFFAPMGVSAGEIIPDEELIEGLIEGAGQITIDFGSPAAVSDAVNIILFLTVIAIAPSILVLMTGFTRILIVLSFVRNALGLQQTPPTQVLIGIALFLTIFLMAPVFTQINEEALQPYLEEELTLREAIDAAMVPVRNFMFAQIDNETGRRDLRNFLNIAGYTELPESLDDIGNSVLIPAFVLNEIKNAFWMGFVIYVPFLIIDLVVASTLMSLGMMMLPPAMVSMPFKLIIFILVGGWNLITDMLMASFR